MTCEKSKKRYRSQKDRKLVSELLDRELEQTEEVHHEADGVLILCKDRAQHILAERRMNALEACGHENWRKCIYCGRYDSPENLYIAANRRAVHHRSCFSQYRKVHSRKGYLEFRK